MLSTGLLLGFALAPAAAAPGTPEPRQLRRVLEVRPTNPAALDVIPNIVFLNRCAGGCTIRPGPTDDARSDISSIPDGGGPFLISEFMHGDAVWNGIVQCVKEVYSPYAVTITDVEPPAGAHYTEAIVAGFPTEIGRENDVGGLASIDGRCNPVNHAMSFSFANLYGAHEGLVDELCWTVAQEVSHNYGLDHSYEFFDGSSACNDPMTYRNDCGGQKFFRNARARCGEFEARACACSALQNTHEWLVTVMGAGAPITTVSAAITTPAGGGPISDGAAVHATASGDRGVKTIELLLNGYRWATLDGAPFGPDGQPATDYAFTLPDGVPDGVIDIEVVARDDIDVTGRSAVVTVTKGAPCVSADSCLLGQQCASGKCFWNPPTAEIGDTCGFDQACVSDRCETFEGESLCSTECRVVSPDATCPAGFDCREISDGAGVCWPPEAGGCCNANRGDAPWGYAGIALAGLAIVLRRRRR